MVISLDPEVVFIEMGIDSALKLVVEMVSIFPTWVFIEKGVELTDNGDRWICPEVARLVIANGGEVEVVALSDDQGVSAIGVEPMVISLDPEVVFIEMGIDSALKLVVEMVSIFPTWVFIEKGVELTDNGDRWICPEVARLVIANGGEVEVVALSDDQGV
ncbi:unnamed protein product [Ilex paraguariensis]|uniref:Uncharacterized protein n=1 Tax=Ilex paraguariensis TaxID=185542 RepID=A0ABC8S976_9AQUA